MNTEWSFNDALNWLLGHNLHPIKYRTYGHQYRFRIRDPDLFGRFITKIVHSRTYGGRSVYLVIGFPK